MLTVLLDSPLALAALIVALLLVNHAVRRLGLRAYSRQTFVEQDTAALPSVRTRLTLPFLLGIVAVSLTLSADRVTREVFGGGYLVMLLASVTLNATTLWTMRPLRDPTALEGHIRISAKYYYRSGGAHTLGAAWFTGAVAILFANLAFTAGTLFLLAVAIGYYRRAQRASRTTV